LAGISGGDVEEVIAGMKASGSIKKIKSSWKKTWKDRNSSGQLGSG